MLLQTYISLCLEICFILRCLSSLGHAPCLSPLTTLNCTIDDKVLVDVFGSMFCSGVADGMGYEWNDFGYYWA